MAVAPDRFTRRLGERLRGAIGSVPHGAALRAWQRHYWAVACAVAAVGVASMGRPFLRRHGVGPPLPHSIDSIVFEYVGWYLSRGHTLYTDVWEIKPPLAHFPPFLFGTLTGTDMYAHHLLGMATTAAALIAAATFAARVVGAVTGSPAAGVASTVSLLAHPDLFYHPWLGYDAKLMVFAFGTAALDRAIRGRYASSGVLAGLAVGFWQLAVVFPAVTTLHAALVGSLEDVRRHVLGGAAAGAVIGLVLLLYADLGGFFAEVVLAPILLGTERGGPHLGTFFRFFPGRTFRWLAGAAVVGFLLSVLDPERTDASALAVGSVLAVGVLLVDFDGFWDTIYPLVFVALGVGLLIGYLPRRVGLAAVVVLALLVAPGFAPSEFLRPDPVELAESDGRPPSTIDEREGIYWTGGSIRSCRFFAGRTQWTITAYYPEGTPFADIPCGRLDPYREVVLRRLPG